jgi:GntR family transcriptional regulator, galactonate operon transcriptional repressor
MINPDSAALRGKSSRKRRLFSYVVEELGRRIVGGEFKPGEPMPNEAELGGKLGASRSVIREAVKSIAAKGLIESRTRTGIRVLAPMHWNLLDQQLLGWRYSTMPPQQFYREIFEIRGLIEPQAAAFAAARASKAEIAEIVAAFAAMEAADQPGNEAIDADLRFHRAVLAAAHNDLLLQMGNLIGVGLMVSYRLSSESYTRFLPLHKEVADAIVARDAASARDAMARLLVDTQTFLKTQLGRSRRAASTGARPPRARAAA